MGRLIWSCAFARGLHILSNLNGSRFAYIDRDLLLREMEVTS